MTACLDRAAMSRRSDLVARYGPRLERWTRGRLASGARAVVDVPSVVRESIEAACATNTGESHVLARARQLIQARLESALRSRGSQRRSARDRAGAPSRSATAGLAAELLERYDACLARLSEADRNAIIVRVELDLPWPDVVVLLDRPDVRAAKLAVSKALVRLAREMAR